MKKTIRTLGAVSALALFASASAGAQNNSDAVITGVSLAANGGNFTPGTGGGALGANTATVRNESAALSNGTASQKEIAAVLRNGSTDALVADLTAGGGSPAAARTLASALSALGGDPSPGALRAAIRAYNALVRSLPAGSLNNPIPQIGDIRAALIAIGTGRTT